MKNLLTALLPALALFALGGCAGTSALATSEDDGVYYSSKDRTTAVASAATVPAGANEAANPDYNGGPASAPARRGSGSDQYYDNTYPYLRGAPSYGVTAYVPYSPYTVLSYGAGYGWGGYGGFSPYPCVVGYDPFFSPFGYGYGSGISINIGYGRPWGYGGGYYGYGRPYGYGGGFYDPFYYSSPFYGGYYGRGGYYGSSYYGGGGYGGGGYYGNQYSTGSAYYGNDNGRSRTSGHRSDRASDGRYSAGSGGGSAPVGNGRVRSERVMAAPGPDAQPMPAVGGGNEGGRSRTETVAEALTPAGQAEQPGNQPRRLDPGQEPRYRTMEPNDDPGQRSGDDGRGRWRTAEAQPQRDQPQPQQEGQRRRGGFFQNVFSEPDGNGGQAAEQPARQRAYDQPRQQRAYEPQQQQRSYEQPQQRSYSQPSYSAPSNGGGGGGGGHSRGRVD